MTRSDPTTPVQTTPLMTNLLVRLQAARAATRQRRVHVRLVMVTIGLWLALGRRTITQILLALGVGDRDWSAWYRLWSRERVRYPVLARQRVAELVGMLAPGSPLVVALDATQVPRSSARFPGVGWVPAPRGPKWLRALHHAQRLEILSGLLPRSAVGDSRAVPIRETLLRSRKTQPVGPVPELSEGRAGVHLVRWLRLLLTVAVPGERDRPLLVLADGAYSTAVVLKRLPRACWLLARCAKNRALYALPEPRPHQRGRKRRYGDRGPTPQAQLHLAHGWQSVRIAVRGRTVRLRVRLSGPWLVHGAPDHPVMLLVVKGVDRGRGVTRRQRDSQSFFLSAGELRPGIWGPPLPVAEALAWAWQRWEVEVMHRELKSAFGLGHQQAWSQGGAIASPAWVLWSYGALILAAYAVWGLGPAPGATAGRWYHPRRWSLSRVLQEVRRELWQLTDMSPGWSRTADAWAEMDTWWPTQTTAIAGHRLG